MPFNYNTKEQNKVIFTRQSAGLARFMFSFIGLLFTIIGFFIFYFNGLSNVMPMAIIQYFIPGMGILGIYVGIILPETLKKSTPDEIIFDNAKGRIEINQKNSEVNTAYIYYDQVADFKIEAKKTSSSSNNSSRTYYSYHIYLLKKDGGQWELLKRNSQTNAEQEILHLKSLINFSVEPQKVNVHYQVSSKYEITRGSEKLELKWRNKVGLGALYLGLFSAVFIAIAYALSGEFTKDKSIPVFGYFVVGFIGLVFVIVIVGNSMKMIKNAKTIYSIVITKSALIYYEKDLADHVRKEVRIPFSELHSISYSFDSESGLRKLYIYTKSQFEAKQTLKLDFSLDTFKRYYELDKNTLSIEIQSLTPVEALHLENYLQQQIKEIVEIETL